MDVDREALRRVELWDEYHADPRSIEMLAEIDGELAGWALFGPSIDADLPDDGQVYAIYALPAFWSAGVGHALMIDAEARLRAAGFTRAHLWVLEGNDRAASFYERHGWREDGIFRDDPELSAATRRGRCATSGASATFSRSPSDGGVGPREPPQPPAHSRRFRPPRGPAASAAAVMLFAIPAKMKPWNGSTASQYRRPASPSGKKTARWS